MYRNSCSLRLISSGTLVPGGLVFFSCNTAIPWSFPLIVGVLATDSLAGPVDDRRGGGVEGVQGNQEGAGKEGLETSESPNGQNPLRDALTHRT